jgi:predicted Rossmann fold flavoprotein
MNPQDPSPGEPADPAGGAPAAEPAAPPIPLPAGPFDVVVAGGGAAALWAAGTAAARGLRVLLLEKNRRVGVKVLASGGGHCNLTTTLAPAAALDAFGPAGARFLGPSVRRLPPAALRDAFHALGVPTREGELEKVWPVSGKARDVLDALVRRAKAAGATIREGTAVLAVERRGAGFLVRTRAGDVEAPRVIVAVGGKSYPKTGTTGDGYAWMEALGHAVTRCVPALAPLVVEEEWVRALAGVDLQDARVVASRDGRTLADRRRPFLFTHTGLSGPGPMDVSRWFELLPPWHRPTLAVDFVPALSEGDVRAAIDRAAGDDPATRIARALPGALPARVAEALCARSGVAPERRVGEVSKDRRHALVQQLKRCAVAVAGTRGFDFAEVTAGGVALEEVDPGTMASRLVPGLFVAGEILDVDGPIGGFNFQAAFSTGETAGRSV